MEFVETIRETAGILVQKKQHILENERERNIAMLK
jgi:hypothetical protein